MASRRSEKFTNLIGIVALHPLLSGVITAVATTIGLSPTTTEAVTLYKGW